MILKIPSHSQTLLAFVTTKVLAFVTTKVKGFIDFPTIVNKLITFGIRETTKNT